MFKVTFLFAFAATLVSALPGQSSNLQSCTYIKNNRQSNCPAQHACKKVGMVGFKKQLCLPIVAPGQVCDKYTACEKGYKCKKQGWRGPKTCVAKKGRDAPQSTSIGHEGNDMHGHQSHDGGHQSTSIGHDGNDMHGHQSHDGGSENHAGDEQGDASAAE